jgi:hypothetical protein
LSAGFFRRSAIESLGRLDERCGCHWSDVDCGLSLQTLGYRCVLEPESVVHGPTAPDQSSLGYTEGRRAERVFWRHISTRGWGPGLVFHPMAVLATVANAWNQASGYTQLLGRLISLFAIASHLAHGARLRERTDSAVEQSAAFDGEDAEFDSQSEHPPARDNASVHHRRAA